MYLRSRIPLISLALANPRSRSRARLSLISRHLDQRPVLELNTPFSTERQSGKQDDIDYTPFSRSAPGPEKAKESSKMSNQPEHPTLLIPGPIEFDDEVLQSMSHYRCVGMSMRTCELHSYCEVRVMLVLLSSQYSARLSRCCASFSSHQIPRLNRSSSPVVVH